jgi:hypothetical protein
MADPNVALALRVEAAKALLPYRELLRSDDPPPGEAGSNASRPVTRA